MADVPVDSPPATALGLSAVLELADWRRRVAELYVEVRGAADPATGWRRWRDGRRQLFVEHPQSPIPQVERVPERLPRYFPYDPALRVLAAVEAAQSTAAVALPASSGVEMSALKVGTARFRLGGDDQSLAVYWLTDYAGGLFVSFRDATSGGETYGAGRYLLDTAKGADLGVEAGRLVFDFNFAYQPSCSYDGGWACPLPPRENWLEVAVRAGEST